MLFSRENRTLHLAWFLLVALVSAAAAGWYFVTGYSADRWPGGGSWPGLVLGAAAGAICLFEFALVLRKTSLFRTRRRILGIPTGSARQWMAAHIWLGLLAVPLAALHAGLEFGGTLSWLLAWSFIVVIVSGAVGLVLQNILPKMMTESAPGETIYSQIDEVGRQLAADAVRLVGLERGTDPSRDRESRARTEELPIVGAPRRAGTQVKLSRQPQVAVAETRPAPELVAAVAEDIEFYLATGQSPSGRLGTPQRIDWYFEDLRGRVPPAARPAVEQLHSMCRRRSDMNRQRWMHCLLHGWLSIHLPLSVVLIWLLLAHAVGALLYN